MFGGSMKEIKVPKGIGSFVGFSNMFRDSVVMDVSLGVFE